MWAHNMNEQNTHPVDTGNVHYTPCPICDDDEFADVVTRLYAMEMGVDLVDMICIRCDAIRTWLRAGV